MSKPVSVLDITSGKISILVGLRGLNNTISILGKGESLYEGFSSGRFNSPSELLEATAFVFQKAQNSARVNIDELTIGVPGEFTTCICKEVSISLGKRRKITKEDIDELHEQGNAFNRDASYSLINSQPIYYLLDDGKKIIQPEGMLSTKLSGYISYVLAESSFIDRLDSIMLELGIKEHNYMSTLVAQSMFLFKDAERDNFVVFIDVDAFTSTITIARGDGILAQFNIPLGGEHIVQTLSKEFSAPLPLAKKLLSQVQLNHLTKEGDTYRVSINRTDTAAFCALQTNTIVGGIIKALAQTVTKALKMSPYNYPDYIPYYLTGTGLAHIRGAKDCFSKELIRPLEIAAPPIPTNSNPALSSSLSLLDMTIRLVSQKGKSEGFFKKLFQRKKGK